MQQTTNTILMVRPVNFRSNEQTRINNYYQKEVLDKNQEQLQLEAEKEYDAFVSKLRSVGVSVIDVRVDDNLNTPDTHFPNNWISLHENGNVAIYPMFAENRRLERREQVLDVLEEKGFAINDVVDYTSAEEEYIFLEGTGSVVLDRKNRNAYCAISPRADEDLFIEFCEDFEYTPVIFIANQTVNGKRKAIYHTNVMMCLAETFAVICLDSIDDKKERKSVIKHLKASGKEIITIAEEQVRDFAGNMLQVKGENDELFLVMSEAAHKSLNKEQISKIEKHSTIISSPLYTIEACGGGSARCMMAEVFLPKA